MKRSIMATTLAITLLAPTVSAQTSGEHDSHHPSDSTESAPVAPAKPSAQGMEMMGMMGDMKNMMGSMSMMNAMTTMKAMGMMGPGAGGMATIDRVEGRIAFLRTELRITDAQANAWTGFADALRANAKKLAEIRTSMMPMSGDRQSPAPTISDRLELQEQWLLARLEGTRTMKFAFSKLNEVLSDEQKKTANDVLVPQMGMGMMAMIASQIRPGQTQPGQMGPGSMQPGQMQPRRK